MGSTPAMGSKNLPIGGTSVSTVSSSRIGGMRAFSTLGDSHPRYVSPISNCIPKAMKGSRNLRCVSMGSLSFPGTQSSTPLKHNMNLCFLSYIGNQSKIKRVTAGNLHESSPRSHKEFSTICKLITRASAGASEAYTTETVFTGELTEREKYAKLLPTENEETSYNRLLNSKLPAHSMLHKGQLANGLRYVILPNRTPPNRFEATMEIHVGSYDEEDDEQGIAHLMECFAFVGGQTSGKLFAPGITSSSLTDFHHTIFQIQSPVFPLEDDNNLLPFALDSLNEIVFKPKFIVSHFTDVRNALLKDLKNIKTVEHIIEGQVLQHLHSENKLSKRFPVGLEEKVKSLGLHSVRKFHERWYNLTNATLYVVGDIGNIPKTIEMIAQFYGQPSLPNVVSMPNPISFDAMASFLVPKLPSVAQKSSSISDTNRVKLKKNERDLRLVHDWSNEGIASVPEPQIFEHEMIQQFSFRILSKMPLNRLRTYRDMRDLAMKSFFLSALQYRINEKYKDSNRPFASIELLSKDSGREGCTTITLKVVADPKNWFDAVKIAINEVRQLKAAGISKSEFARFMSATLRMSEDSASMIDNVNSAQVMKYLMDCTELEHTVMDQKQAYECLISVSRSITFDEVNSIGAKMLEFVSDLANPPASVPTTIVAFIPKSFSEGNAGNRKFAISSSEIRRAIEAGLSEPVETFPPVNVPLELISASQLEDLKEQLNPTFMSLPSNASLNKLHDVETGITQRYLSNGISINFKISKNVPAAGVMHLIIGGGRSAEDTAASVAVGVRTLIECGCVGSYTKEQVELYCISNSLRYSMDAKEEYILMEFHFTARENGLRAAFELLHMILEHSIWQDDAFQKAKQFYQQSYDINSGNAERATSSSLMKAMLSGYEQLANPEPSSLSKLTLESVQQAVLKQLTGGNIEVNLVGDFSEEQIESYIVDYLGTVNIKSIGSQQSLFPFAFCSTPSDLQFKQMYLEFQSDSGVAYIAGPAPNRWGFVSNGPNQFGTNDVLQKFEANGVDNFRNHPLFFSTTMELLAELINSRLCSTLEDSVQASFELRMFDRVKLGWFGISIKSPPFKIYHAVATTLNALRGLSANEITVQELETAKRSLITRHEAALKSNDYWVTMMTRLQALSFVKDCLWLFEAATIEDVQHAYNQMNFDEDSIFCYITLAGSELLKQNLDELMNFMETEDSDLEDTEPSQFVE